MSSLRRFSVSGYALMVVAMLSLIYFKGLFSSSALVIVIQVISVFLMAWARMTFGSRSFHFAADPTEGGLVTTGPYRFIRHPIYASVLYFATAGVAGNLTFFNVAMLCLLGVGIAIRIYCEEKLVVQQYPEYAEYAARTRRIVPFLI